MCTTTISVRILENGFEACGLKFFSADAIDYLKIMQRNHAPVEKSAQYLEC